MNFWKSLNKPIIGLAPMDGVTDFPMREVYSKIAKPDVLFTEFVSAEGLLKNSERLLKTLHFTDIERPIVAQLFGQTPSAFYEATKLLVFLKFDGIDINMGCPARKVLSKMAGGALIGNYDMSEKIINSCLKAANHIPVSVKTRISNTNWYKFLSGFDLSAVCLHGRYLKQGLSGDVDWIEVGKAALILKKNDLIVLGNGGIKSLSDAREKCSNYFLDGILIGRQALGNPWLFIDSSPSKKEVLDAIINHAELAWSFYGERGYPMAIKHFGWYSKGFDKAKELRLKLIKTRTLDETKEVIRSFCD